MNIKKRQQYSDLLELLIVIAMIFLVITIYVPVAIWEEEETVEKESRFRMETIYDLESFFNILTNNYDENGNWILSVVNAVRDSLTADSTFLGEQTVALDGKEILVNIPDGFDVEYDTTFGFQISRRDTTIDTTLTVVTYSSELSRNDTIYIQKKALATIKEDESFRGVINEVPFERIELITYYDTYMPSPTWLQCPLTKQPYQIELENNTLRISSPIVDTYKEPRYFIFSFNADNHGYIEDGSASWD